MTIDDLKNAATGLMTQAFQMGVNSVKKIYSQEELDAAVAAKEKSLKDAFKTLLANEEDDAAARIDSL